MSDYGVFEATSTDGHEEEQRQRQAKRNLGTAIEAAREGFGDFLGSSTDKQDYNDRLALVMNDLMQKVADSGVMPVPGVMRKVKAALRPEFRVADDHENELRRDLFGSRKTASRSLREIAAEIRADWKNVYFGAEPYLDAMSSLDSIDDSYGQDSAKSIVAYFLSNATSWRGETARRVKKELKELSKRRAHKTADQWDDEINRSIDEYLNATSTPRIAPHPEYGEGVWSDEGVKQRVLSLDPNLPTPELVDAIMREMGDYYDSIDRELAFWYFSQVTGNDYDDYYNAWLNIPSGKYFSRRKQAEFDPNISDENLLGGLQIAEALNHDGSNQAKVDELRAEVEARGLTPLKTSRKAAAETFQPGDKVMKSGYPGTVQNEYMDGMYEVKMERGTVVVPAEELTRVSSRKTALKWKDTDFNSWVKMDGGAWSIEVEEVGGDFWLYFNGGPADGQMEQLSASSMEEAKAEAESIASSKGITASRKQAYNGWSNYETGEVAAILDNDETAQEELAQGISDVTHLRDIGEFYAQGNGIDFGQVNWQEIYDANSEFTASRKQAGSAQVLQKLENALNDQRSVDVICSNSPDGSFSGEREIPVDEGLQKVRGWISAGDLVDTAQDGGNFFDFEHRASGENVNFYITQEY